MPSLVAVFLEGRGVGGAPAALGAGLDEADGQVLVGLAAAATDGAAAGAALEGRRPMARRGGAAEAPEEEHPPTRIRATARMATRVNSRVAVMFGLRLRLRMVESRWSVRTAWSCTGACRDADQLGPDTMGTSCLARTRSSMRRSSSASRSLREPRLRWSSTTARAGWLRRGAGSALVIVSVIDNGNANTLAASVKTRQDMNPPMRGRLGVSEPGGGGRTGRGSAGRR